MSQGPGLYQQRLATMPKAQFWKYSGWQRGENSFAQDNEIRDTEFYEGINCEIVGKGSIQLPRRGRELFVTMPETSFNGWGIYKNPALSINLLIVLIGGRLYKITTGGDITEIDNTKTWDTTAKMRGVLLNKWFYFGNKVEYMAKTDGTTVVRWDAITAVTLNTVVLTGSGATDLYSYVITAVTDVGETEASNEIEAWGPATLSSTNKFTVTFNRKTDANVRGYNIYRSKNGGTLRLLSFLDQQASGGTMAYVDDGVDTASLVYEAPTFNTTGGVKGNIFAKYANTLFLTGNDTDPDTVFYGGTGAMWESFNPSDNGGWIQPGAGDGEKCTAMIGFEDFLTIFKENSVWKFVFASDGGPQLISVIPQYGTSSPDTVWRMEKDIAFLGSDGRYRIFGYEPSQLNVLRTADFSNRIQPKLDTIDLAIPENVFGTFFEQKYIVCDGTYAYPYDRRYIGFLGKWTNQTFDRFIVWDKGTGKQKLFGIVTGTGQIHQLLVDGVWDDGGAAIPASVRLKRIDGGEDTILKYYFYTKFKFLNGKGQASISTFKDGEISVDTTDISFGSGTGGVGEFMWGEAMWGEAVASEDVSDTLSIIKKLIEEEAYSIYHQVAVSGDVNNHCILQTMNGEFELEDVDYDRDEKII